MGGTLHVGPLSQTFEDSFLAALEASHRRDPLSPKILLVGSNFLGMHLRHALAARIGAHANLRTFTFVDLAREILFPVLLNEGRSPFPQSGEELLLRQIAHDLPPGNYFHRVADQDGFHRSLKATFHDLIDGGLTALPPAGRKLKDLGALFRLHRERYLPRFLTTADTILEAAGSARTFAETFGAGEFFIYGFYDFTGAQRKLLRKASAETKFHAWVPLHAGAPGFVAGTLGMFRDCQLTETALPETPAVRPVGISAPTEYAEVEEIVREILSVADSTPLHRAAVLGHNQTYSGHAADILERAGVPCYREGGTLLGTSRLGKALLHIAGELGGEWTRPAISSALTLFPLDPRLIAEAGDAADWDFWTREAQVAAGLEPALRRLGRYLNASETQRKFLEFFRVWAADLRDLETGRSGWSAFGDGFARFVEKYAAAGPERDRAAEAARSLSDLAGLQIPFDLSDGARALARRIDGARLPSHRSFDRDGVFVGSLASARGILFDFVALPGLAERAFPAPPKPDPLLPDFERELLNRTADGGLSLKRNRTAEERMLFGLALRQATRRVVLTYPRASSSDGRERLPSVFFTESIPEKTARRRPLVSWSQDVKRPVLDAPDWLAREMAAAIARNRIGTLAGLSSSFPLARSTQAWVERRLGSSSWTEFDGFVDSRPIAKLLPDIHSATDVSRYSTCPYQYFLARIARLKPFEEPESVTRIRATDRGELAHRILFLLFSGLKRENRLPLQKDDLPGVERRLGEIAAEVFESAEDSRALGHRLLWETEREFLLSDLKSLLRAELLLQADFVPRDFEVRFGMPKTSGEEGDLSTDDPLTVALPAGPIRFRGRIDRIDVSADGRRARVVDYKTGLLKKEKDESFVSGQAMQLPIYLRALPVLLPQVKPADSEAVLLSTSYGSGFKQVSFDGGTLAARGDEFVKILRTFSEGLKAGVFIPAPGREAKNCKICDFTRICGKGIERVFERKRDDPAVAAFRALEDIE